MLMTSWALDFESRDYRFLAHESGILPTLQSIVTLTKTASMANSTIGSGLGNTRGRQETLDAKGQSEPKRQRWLPWSLESIRKGFIQVMPSMHGSGTVVDGCGAAAIYQGK